jgi:hypothetical protein
LFERVQYFVLSVKVLIYNLFFATNAIVLLNIVNADMQCVFFELEVERSSFTEAIKTVHSFHTHLLDCYKKVNKYESGNLTTQ